MIARPDESGGASPEALHRFVRYHSGDVRPADERELAEWLAADPAHRAEYEQLDRIWNDIDHLAKAPFLELEEARAWWKEVTSGSSTWFHARRWRAAMPVSAGAFAALALLIVGTAWWSMIRVEVTDYRTGKGEQRTVVLSDGSTVILGADTALSAELSGGRRAVILHHGEALFSVQHEADRPFDVVAANGTVRDVGTQFAVYASSDRVRVSVIEGLVEVRTHGADQSKPAKLAKLVKPAERGEAAVQADRRTVLTKGDRLWYGGDGRLSEVQKVDPEMMTAAFHGKLVFDAMPLAWVIEEVSRYHNGEIRLLDPSLASLRISGVFDEENLDGLLKALERALPVTVTSVNPDLMIVERATRLEPLRKKPDRPR